MVFGHGAVEKNKFLPPLSSFEKKNLTEYGQWPISFNSENAPRARTLLNVYSLITKTAVSGCVGEIVKQSIPVTRQPVVLKIIITWSRIC